VNLLEAILHDIPATAAMVADVRIGPFLTAVQIRGEAIERCGLASTLAQHRPGGGYGVQSVGRLHACKAEALARYLLSGNPLESSIGMATVNALLQAPLQEGTQISILDLVVDACKGQPVAVLGHFPFVERLRQRVKEVHVLELQPLAGDLPAAQASEILSKCRAVILTATVLMNGTYREVLPLCRKPFAVMAGPSTPAASILFDYGLDALAGSTVVDATDTLRTVSQGGTYRDLQGIRKWTWIR
jgi:uncharacterized protein (DUF4213/DUF364 family)